MRADRLADQRCRAGAVDVAGSGHSATVGAISPARGGLRESRAPPRETEVILWPSVLSEPFGCDPSALFSQRNPFGVIEPDRAAPAAISSAIFHLFFLCLRRRAV